MDSFILRTVEIEQLSMAYESTGPIDGSPVLLLHGWEICRSGERSGEKATTKREEEFSCQLGICPGAVAGDV